MKQKKADNVNEWYELWMKQNEVFFNAAQENLSHFFKGEESFKPKDHLQQINDWLAQLQQQWQLKQFAGDEKNYTRYFKLMTDMCNSASDLMLKEWVKRSEENDPVKSIRELYDLWLKCCQQSYQQAMQTKLYQEMYGELMNNAFKYWQSILHTGK